MTLEEHSNLLDKIRNESDDTKRQESLLELSNDYKQMLAEQEETNEHLAKAVQARDNYAKLNNDLWLSMRQKDGVNEVNEDANDSIPAKKTFADLKW